MRTHQRFINVNFSFNHLIRLDTELHTRSVFINRIAITTFTAAKIALVLFFLLMDSSLAHNDKIVALQFGCVFFSSRNFNRQMQNETRIEIRSFDFADRFLSMNKSSSNSAIICHKTALPLTLPTKKKTKKYRKVD